MNDTPTYNVNHIFAGFIGAVIMILKKRGRITWISATVSVVTGTASALYLTPLVGNALHDTDPTHLCGYAFLMGVLGLRGVEWICETVGIGEKKEQGK